MSRVCYGDSKTLEEAMKYKKFREMTFCIMDDTIGSERGGVVKFYPSCKNHAIGWTMRITKEAYRMAGKPKTITGEKLLARLGIS